MSRGESVQKKLKRVRPPHLRITYDVEVGDAIEKREIPFVVGVLGDYAGDTKIADPLEKREFIDITRDNFNDVMRGKLKPTLSFTVNNTMEKSEKPTQIPVNLQFESMDDFEPGKVVEQVPALKGLLDLRNKLRHLKSYIQNSDGGEAMLESILTDMDKVRALASQSPTPSEPKGE